MDHSRQLPEYWNYPLYGSVEAPRTIQVPNYPFTHEVRVWLPPSYPHTDKSYPTLWITDNTLEAGVSALTGSSLGASPELILVSIGCPSDTPMLEWLRRRTYDFLPAIEQIPAEVRKFYADADAVGGAPVLRDFLVDRLRPELADEYRMDPHDHGLAGHSSGATFGLFTLFTRPDAFVKYLLGSPGAGLDYVQLESDYAEAHDDLVARVFIAAGEAEMTEPWSAGSGVWSHMASVVQALTLRDYPSLDLTATVLPGQTHFAAWPGLYAHGVRALWRERISRRSVTELAAMVDLLPWMSADVDPTQPA